jgi:drug/metabolite transporter (DMT)-like permease
MKAWSAFITLSLVWGAFFFGIALAIESFTPYGMVATRYLTSGLIALALSRALGEEWPRRRDLPHIMLQGFLLLTAASALVAWAERYVSSGVAAVLCSTTPLFYAVLGREKLGRGSWAGLVLGLGGVAIVVLSRSGGQRLDWLGIAGILLAVFLWAYGTLHGRRHVRGRGVLGQVGVQMLTGGILGLALVPFTGGFLHAPFTWRAGLALVILVVLVDLTGFSAFIYISRAWPPTRMSAYVYINPVVGVLLGCWILKEHFTLAMGLGTAVIFAGVALLQTQKLEPERTRAATAPAAGVG